MQPHFANACHNLALPTPFSGLRRHTYPSSPHSRRPPRLSPPRLSCNLAGGRRRPNSQSVEISATKKDNPWSIDNELATKSSTDQKSPTRRRRGRRRVKPVDRRRGRGRMVMVSAAMLMEIETVLQTQEPVIKPSWDTFASSVCGIWKGVAAVFSPFTAEMEPVGVGNQNENLYDSYTLSHIEKVPLEGLDSQIQRKTSWVTLNPFGERRKHGRGGYKDNDGDDLPVPDKEASVLTNKDLSLPSFESFDFGTSDVMEEDSMSMDPGLVFFEDGSYSRGPVNITVGDFDESKYFLSPTLKFEQCLVKGCHKRLRIVHTIEFNGGGSNIQIVRIALYEEEWVSPVESNDGNDAPSDLKPVSLRRRIRPSELTGSWKVFEVSATPVFDEHMAGGAGGDPPPMVYLCTESLKKRSLRESSAYFREEEMHDMRDMTVLWLPGGVTAYVDVDKEGVLCIGVGWYSDEGINLVMERDYGMDGKLKEVRWKSEVKRRLPADSSSP